MSNGEDPIQDTSCIPTPAPEDLIYSDGAGLKVYENVNDPTVYHFFYQPDPEGERSFLYDLKFRSKVDGPGLTNEALLTVLSHRIDGLNGKFYSDHNRTAIRHLISAGNALKQRTSDRQQRGVDGQAVA